MVCTFWCYTNNVARYCASEAILALTKRKLLFVAEYLADPKANGSQAAIRAGFSEKRAKVTASELLKDPEVKAAIEHKRNKRLQKLDQSLILSGGNFVGFIEHLGGWLWLASDVALPVSWVISLQL